MLFTLSYANAAADTIEQLAKHNKPKHEKVKKALRLLRDNPRHPSLKTHEWSSEGGPKGEKIFEAYVENDTPGAYRIFFCYPKGVRGEIHIIAVTPHPK